LYPDVETGAIFQVTILPVRVGIETRDGKETVLRVNERVGALHSALPYACLYLSAFSSFVIAFAVARVKDAGLFVEIVGLSLRRTCRSFKILVEQADVLFECMMNGEERYVGADTISKGLCNRSSRFMESAVMSA
jgi:hypothetical protein